MRDINRSTTKIVGVLNATPDSFSDGGKFCSTEVAVAYAKEMILVGADIVDIGGESTRPGSQPVSADVELGRILSICKALAPNCRVSVDTYKASVAEACLASGAVMINDVSALRADPEMVSVAKNHNCEIVLMHSASDGPLPHAPQKNVRTYKDVVTEIAQFLLLRAEFALSKGVAADKIILDPGCGTFISSNPDHSWQLLREMGRFVEAVRPFPVYIGVSRKGFLGGELTHRDPISQLVAVAAVEKGASYVRTHNPGMMSAFLDATARL